MRGRGLDGLSTWTHRTVSPEQRLFQAVILSEVKIALGYVSGLAPSEKANAVYEARDFLLGGERLELFCELAGLNAERIRAWALMMQRVGWPNPGKQLKLGVAA